MFRRDCFLAVAVALVLAPGDAFAQFGGMVVPGAIQPPRPDAAAAANRPARIALAEPGGADMQPITRTVCVEMIDGETISGRIVFGPVSVMATSGQHQVAPALVKIIRFVESENDGDVGLAQADGPGTVILSNGQEIKGRVQRGRWTFTTDYGSFTLDPARMRSMTFVPLPEPGRAKPILNEGGATAAAPVAEPPPLNVWPVFAPEVAAVAASGPNITRLAASRPRGGEWRTVDLKEPFSGDLAPAIAGGVAAYQVGDHLFAYSAAFDRWEVATLPNRDNVTLEVRSGIVIALAGDHVLSFDPGAGKWRDVDLRALVTTAPKAPGPPAKKP
ncbi:hypothetical protein OJF2_25330 [Aquisphaera giovannonii]|uniref:Uncharacterized protein n=1 Tax=Aquisphaera giovannonii TaxID=406548 RepID=A0A5B9W1Z5_9BACT|nr:hypothetical protein [Aquisphaera giovannonii]QEH34000.1 hypothetical protein OJF2_25330 [Aquisphaera giovannonii]